MKKMKTYYKFTLLGILFVLFAFVGCDEPQLAKQDASPIISPDDYPTVSITTSGDAIEGATKTYTISISNTIDHKITFTPSVIGGTADDHDYAPLEAVTIEPYTTSVEFPITLINDFMAEDPETLEIQLEILPVSDRYLLRPGTVLDPISFTFDDYFDPTLLVIYFEWDSGEDYDMVTWSDTTVYPHTEWGDGGATLANPEHDTSIWLSDPVGTYYVNVMEWWVGADFNYTFTLVHPDASIQIIEGTFTGSDLSGYTYDGWTAWGGEYPSYRVLEVVNDGTEFVVTAL